MSTMVRYRRSTGALAWTMVFSFAGLAVAAVGTAFALASLMSDAAWLRPTAVVVLIAAACVMLVACVPLFVFLRSRS